MTTSPAWYSTSTDRHGYLSTTLELLSSRYLSCLAPKVRHAMARSPNYGIAKHIRQQSAVHCAMPDAPLGNTSLLVISGTARRAAVV